MKPLKALGGLLLGAGVLYLGFGVDRMEFWSLFLAFIVAFGGYLLLVYRPDLDKLRWWIGLGLLLRFLLIFAFPLLSDDVYRFIWDGQLIVSGHNPFAHLPAYYLEPGNFVPGLDRELFERLNSPEYYTIYPPVAQGVFTAAAWLSPHSWFGASVVMKLFLFGGEVGSLFVFWRLLPLLSLPRERLLLYWLNPLIIVEIMGNLHFEGAMVCALLMALLQLVKGNYVNAAGAMAVSVAAKLLPLMLLPHLIRRLWLRPFLLFSVAFGVATLLLFTPLLLSGFLEGFSSSLDLYFRKFEFNASLYYLLRAYGYYEVGWNQIARFGPLLARLAVGLILLFALLDRRTDWKSLAGAWLWVFTIYLLCATTVHPWYLSVPIVLCTLTRWRFPLVWSFLIMLTYTNYLTVPYQENLWLVAVEYLLVAGFVVWEVGRGRGGRK